jgi:PTH1 family peptidyl-tRNA hydrolase
MSAILPGPTFRLIVGLGNPGREYCETRHNVGFMVLDRIAAGEGVQFKPERKWRAEVARSGDVFYCKPHTYMNLSGEAVRAVSQFYKITPEQILVVTDDLALPLGKVRLRPNGSSGGQKGLKSIIEHLGTQEIARVRIGIGSAQPGEAVDHVLGKFAPDERPLAEESIGRAVDAIACAQNRGLQAAMNTYN